MLRAQGIEAQLMCGRLSKASCELYNFHSWFWCHSWYAVDWLQDNGHTFENWSGTLKPEFMDETHELTGWCVISKYAAKYVWFLLPVTGERRGRADFEKILVPIIYLAGIDRIFVLHALYNMAFSGWPRTTLHLAWLGLRFKLAWMRCEGLPSTPLDWWWRLDSREPTHSSQSTVVTWTTVTYSSRQQ